MTKWVLSVVFGTLLVGCSRSGDPMSMDSDTGNHGPLKITNLSATSSTITGGRPAPTESMSTTLVAIVTDTHGLDAIAGGTLTDTQGNTYGAFGTGAEKGTFTAAIDWVTMNSIAAIDFADKGGTRELVATFFDNDGNQANAHLTLTLQCRDADLGLTSACGGVCTYNLNANFLHCGTCPNACSGGDRCMAGSCVPIELHPTTNVMVSDCFDPRSVAPLATCDTICQAAGSSNCIDQFDNFATKGMSLFTTPTCDSTSLAQRTSCEDEFRYIAAAGVTCFCH